MNHLKLMTNGARAFIEGDVKLTEKMIAEENFISQNNHIELIKLGTASTQYTKSHDYDSINVTVKLENGEDYEVLCIFSELKEMYETFRGMTQVGSEHWIQVEGLYLAWAGIGLLRVVNEAKYSALISEEEENQSITHKDLVAGKVYKYTKKTFLGYDNNEYTYLGRYFHRYTNSHNMDSVGLTHVFLSKKEKAFLQLSNAQIKSFVKCIAGKDESDFMNEAKEMLTSDVDTLIDYLNAERGDFDYWNFGDTREGVQLFGLHENKKAWEQAEVYQFDHVAYRGIHNKMRDKATLIAAMKKSYIADSRDY